MQITVEVNSRLLCDDAARDLIITTLAETYLATRYMQPHERDARASIGGACDRGIRIGMALVLGGTEAAEAVARQK